MGINHMQINQAGLDIIKFYEGLEDGDLYSPGLDPYLDPVGIATIGWGSTYDLSGQRITLDHPAITRQMAEKYLRAGLANAEDYLAHAVSSELTSNQFSALVSLVYNIGSGNFQASTLRAKLNRGDYEGAAHEFWKWRRARGQILPGLVKRRKAEELLFLRI